MSNNVSRSTCRPLSCDSDLESESDDDRPDRDRRKRRPSQSPHMNKHGEANVRSTKAWPYKRKKYASKFKKEWTKTHSFIRESRLGEKWALCANCNLDFKISHGGYADVRDHMKTKSHIAKSKIIQTNTSLTDFVNSPMNNEHKIKVARAELLFTGWLTANNVAAATADTVSTLFTKMFPDSKIAESYKCGRTKTNHILNGVLAPEAMKGVLQAAKASLFGIATDAGSDENDKYLPILITHENADGLITTSFLDMPSVAASDAQSLFNGTYYIGHHFV